MTQVSMEELMAGLPGILAAPKDEGPVRMLCQRPAPNKRVFPQSLRLTRAEGIPGDRWQSQPWLRTEDGRPDPRIQVSILPSRVLDLVWRDRDSVVHPGDPIVADLDMSLANLPEGSLVAAGSAVLRVSGLFNEGCAKWKVRYGADARAFTELPGHPELRLRGILCAVEEDGEVAVGDVLRVLRRGA